MKQLVSGFLLLPVLVLAAGLSGCGKEDKPKVSIGPKLNIGGGEGAKAGPKEKIAGGKAKLVGHVVYDGSPPAPGSLVPVMKEHKDHDYCLAGKDFEKEDQTWFVDKAGNVEYAVVWVNPPDGAEFEVKNSSGEAVLDQPHCVYIPHVLAVKPGQKFVIKNSAPMAHNTKLDVDTFVNRPFGQTIPPKGDVPVDLKPQDKPITAACDFHGWMKAKIWVWPTQYIAVTKADGTFEIDGLPEDKEVSIVAWHEGAGFFGEGGKKGHKMKLSAGDNKMDFKVKAQ